jgi:uncharacterized protein (TIGR04255 family)
MPGSWNPIHENHAIDVMAALVTFSQPIPNLLLNKALKRSEDASFAAGLRSRHRTAGIAVVIDSVGVSSGAAPPMYGRIFNSLVEGEETTAGPPRLAEQLQVTPTQIIYRTWSYVSWTWQIERMKTLMGPAISTVQDSVSFAMQRLEYLDRFRFEGDLSDIELTSLLRAGSPLIAPHVFSRTDLWHSHTGAFLPSPDGVKRLEQVFIDCIDEPAISTPDTPKTRWINVMTAREDRFPEDGVDEPERNCDFIFNRFDQLHSELKETFGSVVTDDVARRIYLRES